MAEKKERQFVVMKQRMRLFADTKRREVVGRPVPTVWFDARRDAREEAELQQARSRVFKFYVEPMRKGLRRRAKA